MTNLPGWSLSPSLSVCVCVCVCVFVRVGGWACACVGGERFSNSNRIIPSDYRILLLLKMPIPNIYIYTPQTKTLTYLSHGFHDGLQSSSYLPSSLLKYL